MDGFSAPRARQKLADLAEANRDVWRAEAVRFRIWAEFADEYTCPPGEGPVLDGMERMLCWGAEGTPAVAEFCVLEVAAALAMDQHAVKLAIGQALSVRHRLPHVWEAVMAGRLRVWTACDLAGATTTLSLVEALALDAEIAPDLGAMSRRRLLSYVKGRVTDLRPDDAQSEHDQLKAQCTVGFEESSAGFTRLWATIPSADAVFLKARIDQLAGILGKCHPRHFPTGDADGVGLEEGADLPPTESWEMRRAQALGVLASPAWALQLLQADRQDQLPMLDPQCPAAGMRSHTCGSVTVDPDALLPVADLVVHLTDGVLRDGEGVARGEQVGPVLAGWLKELLGHTRVRVRPVLDAGNQVPTDAYECPARMREAVELRNPYEVFPHSQRRSRRLDMDHSREWRTIKGHRDQVPIGRSQHLPLTRYDNFGPLSRFVHRAKTSGGWELVQPRAGVFLWTSPLGFGYLVTPSRSWMITDPTGRILDQREPADQVSVAS